MSRHLLTVLKIYKNIWFSRAGTKNSWSRSRLKTGRLRNPAALAKKINF